VDDGIVVSGKGGEEVGVFHQIGGGGVGHFAAVLGMGEYIGGGDGNAVQIAFLPHEDVHGDQADVPLPEQRFGQIAGAVRSDLDVQNEIPLFQPRVVIHANASDQTVLFHLFQKFGGCRAAGVEFRFDVLLKHVATLVSK